MKTILCSVVVLFSMNSFGSASTHSPLPSAYNDAQPNMEYYANKESRCLNAFSLSEFEVAYSICTPLANLGYKDAQLVTGLLYAYGEGVDKDLRRAKIWLNEALKNGRVEAAQALNQFGLN